jgi:DASH complex subunit SPC19
MAHSLEGCISSLRESLALLDSSIKTLDAGVSDFPRLAKVLQTTRVRIPHRRPSNPPKSQNWPRRQHFELVSEPDLQAAQASLLSEIQPEVDGLLSRVEAYLDKMERREKGLMARCDLQEGRLSSTAGSASSVRKTPRKAGAAAAGGGTVSAIRMSQARQKKERLSYAIDRLQLQAQQKERQLRKSLAAPLLEE